MRVLAQPGRVIPWLSLLFVAGPVLVVVGPVLAGPVLHERFEPDPSEDLRWGATTPSGTMPATLETRSGLVSAPDEAQAAALASDSVYGGAHTPSSADNSYHIDRLTTRPERVRYDEPFRPSILPFKRLYAFDSLKPDLSFGVLDEELTRVTVGGTVEEHEDAFFADFEVDLVADVPVRIPSVGPGARVRALHVDPPGDVVILEDSAENWFVRAPLGGRARMVLQLSIDRRTFGSRFPNVSWSALQRHVPPLPEAAASIAHEVSLHVGVAPTDSPAQALETLVDYFRRFEASADLPEATDAAGLYRELSLEQKGVCRHRAYAFTITALSLGLPTRIVHNEAHAWVEVFDEDLWHRIDLGGAASDIQQTRDDPLSPQHRPPGDPFVWPAGSTSGLDLVRRPQTSASNNPDATGNGQPDDPEGSSGWPSASTATSGSNATGQGAHGQATGAHDSSATDTLPADISFRVGEVRLLRGHPLSISGVAQKGGSPCKMSRVDVYYAAAEGKVAVGSVATDREGKFSGAVTLPPTTPVGPLSLTVEVGAGCE